MSRAAGLPFSGASALALALLLAAAPAAAEDPLVQAKALFNVGVSAYEAGQYPAAIQALAEAYRIAPRPGLLFSLAQARRKQFYVEKQPAELREAIHLYREYVAAVGQGGRRAEAVDALAELEPIAARLGAAADAPATGAPSPSKAPTRLMVSAETREATIALDGGKPAETPLIAEVTPGKHTVRLTAPGYFPEEREVQAIEGGVVALDVAMREQPGRLAIRAPDGAGVAIDGQSAAVTPLARPLEVKPGRHLVAVTKRGHKPFAEEMDIGRGETRDVAVRLAVTGQRVAAYTILGVAALSVAAGGGLAGGAVYEQGKAQALDAQRTSQGGLSSADLARYAGYAATRDDLRTAAGVSLGAGVLLGGVALVLALADQPTAGPTSHRDGAPPAAAPPPRERPVELSAAPVLAPGLYGVALGGRF